MALTAWQKVKLAVLTAWYSTTGKLRFTIGKRTYGFTPVDDWKKRYGVEDT